MCDMLLEGSPRRAKAGLVCLAVFGGALIAAAPFDRASAQDLGFSPSTPPALGLSTDSTLGLPGARYDAPFQGAGRRAPRTSYRREYRYRVAPRYWAPGYYPPGYDWMPWYAAPQTIPYKAQIPAVYATPRLGLQYIYPYPNDIGLELPPDPDEPLIPARTSPEVEPLYPAAVVDAIAWMQQGRYADAGLVLADALRGDDAPVEVYVLIAEVLVASGKYDHAARIFRHGIESAPSLAPLAGFDVASHFPSREAFEETLKRFEESVGSAGPQSAGYDIQLLDAGLRLLAGDTSMMERLEALQAPDSPVAVAARKLYYAFLDALFAPPAAAAGAETGAGSSEDQGTAPPEHEVAPEKPPANPANPDKAPEKPDDARE